jgi:hypothetical protein
MSSSCYDIIIVGAGISGLRVGIQLLTTHPHLRCCILEKYTYNGGRVITYHKNIKGIGQVQWENGAGRISTSHKKVLGLIKKYNLTFARISGDSLYLDRSHSTPIPNPFTDLIDLYLTPLKKLSTELLQTHTLGSLLHHVFGPKKAKAFYSTFPYYAEIHTLRADLGLISFDSEMHSNKGFGVCVEGLSSIIQSMVDEFKHLGGTIQHGIELQTIHQKENNIILGCYESCTKHKRIINTKTCVLALHSDALKIIRGVSTLPVLNRLKMEPLLRIYAVFPVIKGKCWFSDLSKIITPDPIRYIIPMDPSKGIIMISYSEGPVATYWMKLPSNQVETKVMNHIRLLFPDRAIPDPLFFKLHPWTSGCTYWLPGLYNVEEESKKSLQPMPNKIPRLFMCGESFSLRQAWMEGSLEQADHLLQLPAFQSTLNTI